MVCFNPITVWKQTKADLTIPANDYYALKKISFRPAEDRIKIQIPCGRCIGCRLDHANAWATRVSLEAKDWKNNCFITLTYNNKNLPTKNKIPTLKKKDFQDFMKRLRYYQEGCEEWTNPKTDKKEKPIRFFMCGEYGPRGGRPHYHMACFNWKPKDLKVYKINKQGDTMYQSKELQKIWGKGFVVIEELNYNTASYVARYVMKKSGIEPNKREYTGEIHTEQKIDERNGEEFTHFIREQKTKKTFREEEFILMSRAVGIGKKYWDKNKQNIKLNKGILLKIKDKVKLKSIPRYYKKLWETENWEECERYKYQAQKDAEACQEEILKKVSIPDNYTKDEKIKFYLKKQEEILKDKAKYLKRNEFI